MRMLEFRWYDKLVAPQIAANKFFFNPFQQLALEHRHSARRYFTNIALHVNDKYI